jgi:hypothetical protein
MRQGISLCASQVNLPVWSRGVTASRSRRQMRTVCRRSPVCRAASPTAQKPFSPTQTHHQLMSDRVPNTVLSRPGRSLAEEVASMLGFKRHDIPILVKARLLRPLGNPAPHAVKYFAACEVQMLACDADWLGRATKAVATYWAKQNQKRRPKNMGAGAITEKEKC